jgi:hypothetical protein
MSSPEGKDSWKIHRSIEVLGYHGAERCVRVLVVLLAENQLSDKTNKLNILHRGNVTCHILKPWPLPRHMDEDQTAEKGILEQYYAAAFKEYSSRLFRTDILKAWDQWEISPEPQEVIPWSPLEAQGCNIQEGNFLAPVEPYRINHAHIPFTSWTLEPFNRKALYLISFQLEFSGETYGRLIEHDGNFSVDGPERLLNFIESEDLADLEDRELAEWSGQLADFADCSKRVGSVCYDVIIVNPPFADAVSAADEWCRKWIYPAPKQNSPMATRFVTTSQWFTIALYYDHAREYLPAAANR